MSMRLKSFLLGAALLIVSGCATNPPHPADSDMSGRPYVLAMGKHLASARQFSVRVRSEKDQLIDGGAVVGPTEHTIRVRRPDRLAVQVVYSQGRRKVWYDGSRVVCLEVARGAYASVPAQGSVEDMFNALRRGYHYVRPLASLLDADPGPALCAKARRVSYLGKKTLEGRPCNVVRMERDDASIDLWIPDTPEPLLMQAVVRQPDAAVPERVSRFDQWNLQPRFSDAEFKPQLPAGAYQIEMVDVTGIP